MPFHSLVDIASCHLSGYFEVTIEDVDNTATYEALVVAAASEQRGTRRVLAKASVAEDGPASNGSFEYIVFVEVCFVDASLLVDLVELLDPGQHLKPVRGALEAIS